MAADSDGEQQQNTTSISNTRTLKAVVICEGNLQDPDFQSRLDGLVEKLTSLVEEPASTDEDEANQDRKKSGKLTVDKVEPWNSVRVTLSIPKEAAIKLRRLAAEGNSALRALGILSVQLEGDTVLSLRLVGQEIVLRTDNSAATAPISGISSSSNSGLGELTRILSQQQQQQPQVQLPQGPPALPLAEDGIVAGPSKVVASPQMQPKVSPIAATATVGPALVSTPIMNGPVMAAVDGAAVFKSPNTICPMDGKLPAHVPNVVDSRGGSEYPFESMTQARVIQRRENTLNMGNTTVTSAAMASLQTVASGPAGVVVKTPTGNHFVAPNPPGSNAPPPYPASLTGAKTVMPILGPPGSGSGHIGNVAMTSPLLVNLLQNESAISQSLAAAKNKSSGINKHQEPSVGVGGVISKVTAGSAMNAISENEQSVNSGVSQKTSTSTCNMAGSTSNSSSNNNSRSNNNNPVHPVISGNSESGVVATSQTIVVNSGVVPIAAGSAGQPISASANNTNSNNMMTNSSSLTNTANNNQSVINVQPSLITPPMSVPSSSKHVNVQQPRFNLGLSGAAVARPSQTQQQQQQTLRPPAGMIPQQQRPLQQSPLQPTHSQELSLSRFPAQQQFRQPAISQQQQQRWPSATPQSMDSATKTSFQEFTRYQMQYNLSQQQLNKQQTVQQQAGASGDLLSLGLGDLPDLGKNDLDSLLPTLNSVDLEGAFLDGLDLDLEHSLTPTGIKQNVQQAAERKWKQQFLINPLTGELEETQTEETEDNDEELLKSYPEFNSEMSNSLYSDDDDNSCSTGFSKFTSDVSDTERSATLDGTGGFGNNLSIASSSSAMSKLGKPSKMKKEKAKDSTKNSTKSKEKKPREKKSSLKQVKTVAKIVSTESGGESPGSQEAIKLRLKLDKSEAISVSLVQTPVASGSAPSLNSSVGGNNKKVQSSQVLAESSGMPLSGIGGVSNSTSPESTIQALPSASLQNILSSSGTPVSELVGPIQQSQASSTQTSQQTFGNNSFMGTNNSAGLSSTATTASSGGGTLSSSPAGEELRVPPLHISLRGKKSVVIKNSKKDRKKSQSGGEEDSDGSGYQFSKKTTIKQRSSHSTDSRLTVVMTSDASIRLKVEEPGPSSLPSSPNHHNHIHIGSTMGKLKSNKLEDLNPSTIAASSPNDSGPIPDHQHKRSASDLLQSPNGLILCPEKRRRLSAGPSDLVGASGGNSINEINEIYETLISSTEGGPIGSTNVGTLPQSSLLAAATSSAKNLKSSSTNNSINNNNAFGKCTSSNSGSNFSSSSSNKSSIKPTQSSPTTSSVSSPGALVVASNTLSSTQSPSKPSSPVPSSPSSDKITATTSSGKPPPEETVESGSDSSGNYPNISSNPVTTTSSPEVSINQRISTTVTHHHHHHHNRPPEKAGDSPASTSSFNDQSPNHHQHHTQQQQQVPSIASASGHLHSSQGVRGSPGSQAQGEDSGIESMDALSEKSPHQLSHSPQGTEPPGCKLLRVDSPKDKVVVSSPQEVEPKESLKDDSSNNNNNTNIDEYIDIEAALAKMEGLSDIQVTAATTVIERPVKLNGDHTTLMKPNQTEEAQIKLDSANLSKILDDIDDVEMVVMSESPTTATTNIKGNSIDEMSSSAHSGTIGEPVQKEPDAVTKGEEEEDWLLKAEKKQQQQQQQQQEKGEANDILTSNSNNNLTDKAELKLDTKQLVLEDCCSNKEVFSLKSECDSKIVDCKTVIKNDPEEAIVSSVKQEDGQIKSGPKNSSSVGDKNNDLCVSEKNGNASEGRKNVKSSGVEQPILSDLKPRHEQPPLYSYSSEKARERRSAANSTSSNSSTPTVVDIIDLDDSGKSDLDPPEKQIHSPLSIDIPTHPESAEKRIRTRASSKLESPLEPPRQSPSIDSPAAERLKNTGAKNVSTVSTVSVSTNNNASGGDRLSPKTLPKTTKRKRQGSESSTQSCLSDDIAVVPSRIKKPRKASAPTAAITSSERQRKPPSGRGANLRKAATAPVTSTASTSPTTAVSTTITVEDSSDSDEPLIEIAGTSGTVTTPTSAEEEKPVRNSKSTSGAKNSSTSSLPAVTSNNPSNKQQNTHLRSASASSHTQQQTATATQDEKISTRRSVRMTTSTLSTAAMNNKAKEKAAAQTSTVSENHRDSSSSPVQQNHHVGTGAAGEQQQHNSKSNNHQANNHQNSVVAAAAVSIGSGGSIKGSCSNTSAETKVSATAVVAASVTAESNVAGSTPEGRRKTRSAGLETTTEGRRRRASRDSK
ncbi:mucin-5AC-like isoform X2 [Uranotaenia lowii]|uniref:mucin-5AC-like isoform X2 n=1 Tax=Uranotaenia lowii TaxID=190385 RepID=UPI002478778D|nr:mucin-5AC-like isoform X2 [Uranotaenia lowii]